MDLKPIYKLRQDFSIIGITGRTGSGCTKLGRILSSEFREIRQSISFYRTPADLDGVQINFKRKYTVAYSYAKENWKPYIVIQYKNILYTLLLIEHHKNPNIFDDLIEAMYSEKQEFKNKALEVKNNLEKVLDPSGKYDEPIRLIKDLAPFLTDKKEHSDLIDPIQKLIAGTSYKAMLKEINTILSQHYIQRTFLLHKVACNYRKYGSAIKNGEPSSRNLYTIVSFINLFIKGIRKDADGAKQPCHVVIDSLRNSLEIMFLKERYAAFHMVAVKGERRQQRLESRITATNTDYSSDEVSSIAKKLLELDNTEYKTNDFHKRGVLSSPDVQNCISQSDIHLFNSDESELLHQQEKDVSKLFAEVYFGKDGVFKDESYKNSFFSLSEQAIKLQTLIQQPGLITPSSVERCMQIAYSAKVNSGCISRQVGAVVADQNYSIKSVGWNDVPAGSMPCNLRDVRDLVPQVDGQENEVDDRNFKGYSLFTHFESGKGREEYERGADGDDESYLLHKETKGFSEFMKETYSGIHLKMKATGKPCSFCFKTAYNKFTGEDNQVHTRSLHAEENAMLQISKYGGQALENGILFTTASPCELCSKKAYQLGIKVVYYIDPYPGISRSHVLKNSKKNDPEMRFFRGAVGRGYHKLYEPFLAYKDEISLQSGIIPSEPLKVQQNELIELLIKLKEADKEEIKARVEKLEKDELDEKLEALKNSLFD